MAGKVKTKAKPVSRAKTRGVAGRAPLLVLAGLPQATAGAAANTINNDGKTPWRATAVAFPDRDPVYDVAAVEELAAQVLAYARENYQGEEDPVNPTRIALAYVDDEWTQPLWEVFGSAVFPVRMTDPGWEWPDGRPWRFDTDAVHAAVNRARIGAESEEVTATRLRLEAHRRDDPLLLPARNFELARDAMLHDRFLALLESGIAPADIAAIDEDVESRKFPFKHLPKFYAKTGGQNKSFAIDRRDLVFAKAHVGQDGGLHDIPADAEEDLTAARLRRELESRFRFGTPLQPPGFQHDVQREFGAPLVRERMFCIDRGPVNVFGDHANVFGSDMITADRIEDAQNE
ncbi:hypothetical protein [uncultured Brevundimonas sp.]|uniref:hypothetical protein n=1 Tax=uncultured Brevundimonas sp. TaxID=213418 RepID=UPI0025F37E57|nr:hypothetical protein [uncultured Brevundimonas sp.]